MELAGLDVQNGGGAVDGAEAVQCSGIAKEDGSNGVFDQFPFRLIVRQKSAVGFQVSGDLRGFLRFLAVVDEGAGFVDSGSPAGGRRNRPCMP